MVYCGKPSKGCGHCRSRKIRCDQVRPACSQCVRAKRDCPGYRDQLSLMFRDESSSVVKKASAGSSTSVSSASSSSRPKKSPGRSPRTASPDGNSQSDSSPEEASYTSLFDFNADPLSGPLIQQLQQPWQIPMEVQPVSIPSQEEAISFLFRSNAIPGSFWMSDFVTKFLAQAGSQVGAQAMRASMTAVASAMLCRVRKMTALRDVARKEYVNALNLLNIALADIEEAKTNQALGAVVLLAIYEVRHLGPCRMTCRSNYFFFSFNSLSQHVPHGISLYGQTTYLALLLYSTCGALINLRPKLVFVFFCI